MADWFALLAWFGAGVYVWILALLAWQVYFRKYGAKPKRMKKRLFSVLRKARLILGARRWPALSRTQRMLALSITRVK